MIEIRKPVLRRLFSKYRRFISEVDASLIRVLLSGEKPELKIVYGNRTIEDAIQNLLNLDLTSI